jgi:hypothetical protein
MLGVLFLAASLLVLMENFACEKMLAAGIPYHAAIEIVGGVLVTCLWWLIPGQGMSVGSSC